MKSYLKILLATCFLFCLISSISAQTVDSLTLKPNDIEYYSQARSEGYADDFRYISVPPNRPVKITYSNNTYNALYICAPGCQNQVYTTDHVQGSIIMTSTSGLITVVSGYYGDYYNFYDENFEIYKISYELYPDNVAIGSYALGSNTWGYNNSALGNSAGRYISNGITANVTGLNSLFIGSGTKAQLDAQSNQIVIGYNAIGNGSNTVTLGNDSIQKTILKGNVGIGGINPNSKLHIVEASQSEFYGTDLPYTKSNFVVQGTDNQRMIGRGPSITFSCPAYNNSSNCWEQARILATPDNTNNGDARGRLYLQVRDQYNPQGIGGMWNWRTGLMIAANGNVGIGITNSTPTEKIQIGNLNNAEKLKLFLPGVYNFEQVKLGQYGNGACGLEFINHTSTSTSSGVRFYSNIDNGINGLQIQTASSTGNYANLAYNTQMTILNNGNVGIGTTSDAKLAVAGTIKSINDIYSWDNLAMWSDGENSYIQSNGDENGLHIKSNSANKIILESKVGIGISNITTDALLTVNGAIHAKEVRVNLTGLADFVFDDNYKLMPLHQVEQFVKSNNHLPEIPSAAEVSKNGLSMGEMQNKLLQKIEELTLYVIEQQKRIEQLEKNQK